MTASLSLGYAWLVKSRRSLLYTRGLNEVPLLYGPYTELDCLQSAFSLKIRLVLLSSSTIANQDVVITIRD